MFLNKRIKSFGYAFKGLFHLFRTEAHAQIHLVVLIVVVGAGFYFHITKTEWLAVLLSIGMVISLEAINTAIERLTDLVSPDYHPLAGHAKDVAAGAVLWAAIVAVIVGFLVFWPYIF
jgi:diacylglycerol kinase